MRMASTVLMQNRNGNGNDAVVAEMAVVVVVAVVVDKRRPKEAYSLRKGCRLRKVHRVWVRKGSKGRSRAAGVAEAAAMPVAIVVVTRG
jgi:hypothetical protein